MMYFADGTALARIHCEKRIFPEFTQSKGEVFNWRRGEWAEDDMIGSYMLFKANYYEHQTPDEIHAIIAGRLGEEVADRVMEIF